MQNTSSIISIQIVDPLYAPVKGLAYQIMDFTGQIRASGATSGEGKLTIDWTGLPDMPLLCVKRQFTEDYKPLFTIDMRGMASLILVSPKVLAEIALQSEGELGAYRRGVYQVKQAETLSSIASTEGVTTEFLANLNEQTIESALTANSWLNIPSTTDRK